MNFLRIVCLIIFFLSSYYVNAQELEKDTLFDVKGMKITLYKFDSLIINYNYLTQKDTSILRYNDFVVIIRLANTLEAYKIFDNLGRMRIKQQYYEDFLKLYANILYDKALQSLKDKHYFRNADMQCKIAYEGMYFTKIDSIARYIPTRNTNSIYIIHTRPGFMYAIGAFPGYENNSIYKIIDIDKQNK